MNDVIRSIEEKSMNAWPSLQTFLYDGWVIRFANGYSKRANSINPIYVSREETVHKIESCETVFSNRQLKPTYKITPVVSPEDLDNRLAEKGYSTIDQTSVQIVELTKTSATISPRISVFNGAEEKWLEECCRLNGITQKNRMTLKSMLANIVPEKFPVSLILEDQTIACGLGVMEGEYIGLFDIVVDANFRRQGYGEELVRGLLAIGKTNEARFAYLQVVLNNLPALKLYEKLGFREAYRYWYRVKEISMKKAASTSAADSFDNIDNYGKCDKLGKLG